MILKNYILCKCRFVNVVGTSNFTEREIRKNINHTRFERTKRAPDLSQEEYFGWNTEKLRHLLGIKNISDE